MLQLHQFMVAISQVSVEHDGRSGSAPDPFVSDQVRGVVESSVLCYLAFLVS